MLKSYETADFKIKLNDKLSYISLGYWAVVSFYDFQKVQIFFSCQLLFFIVYTQSPSQPVLASCPWGGWSVYLLWISNCPDNVWYIFTWGGGEGKNFFHNLIPGYVPLIPQGYGFCTSPVWNRVCFVYSSDMGYSIFFLSYPSFMWCQ